MELPKGCYIDGQGKYDCYCTYGYYATEDELREHFNTTFDTGFCKTGLRFISKDEIECICGNIYETRTKAAVHIKLRRCDVKVGSYCKKCELKFQSVAHYKQHCTTKKHIEGNGPTIKDLSCEACNIKCWSPKHMKIHLESAKHTQRSTEGTLPLTCDVCQITCKGQKQMKAHLETNKHKKKTNIQ
jgi:hypothetical protein